MKHTLALTLLASLLVGCATNSQVVLRRGKLIERDTASRHRPSDAPAAPVALAPAPVAVKTPSASPAPAPATAPAAPVPAPAPVVAAQATPVPATEQEIAAFKAPLVASRSGTTVQLAWTLPGTTSGYRAIEIMRNSHAQATGRGRVRAVRAETTRIEDTVPDAGASYWYWLKITHVDGTVQNLGPFAATSES